jgi:SPP1 gp7 family putative phage head morphogenesis protein
MKKHVDAPREPEAIEATHIGKMVRVWRVIEGIVAQGLSPLLEAWPVRGDMILLQEYEEAFRGHSRPRNDVRKPRSYNPLTSGSCGIPMHELTDEQIRKMWPGIDPDDIRRFAPWATSHSEVQRVAFPEGLTPGDSLEDYVARSVAAERSRVPDVDLDVPDDVVPHTPNVRTKPAAFGLSPSGYGTVILGPNGLPIPLPPVVRVVTEQTIARQMDWIEMALGRVITIDQLEEVLLPTGEKISRWNRIELERVLEIDLRSADTGIAKMIDQWRDMNVGLINQATLSKDPTLMRPSLLADISEVIEDAHRKGLRVDELADILMDRFSVSESRAKLIARDQVLKLNGQITKHRQTSAGISKYKWSTSKDERVRPGHRDLHGTIQSWASPPDVGNGRHEHPGGDYQCRCVSIPVLPD